MQLWNGDLRLYFIGKCTANDEEVRQKAIEILNGEITNVFEAADNSATLSVQPLPYDLCQFPETKITLIKGNTNDHFNLGTLFNSDASGSYGAVTCLFPDGLSPENDTVIQITRKWELHLSAKRVTWHQVTRISIVWQD